MKPSPAALKLAEKILRHLYGEFFHPNDLRDVPEVATLIDESNKELVVASTALSHCLVKTVREALPSYPESQMMIAKDLSVEGANAIIANHQPKPE